ncbi:MAG: hypothetical protein WCH34_10615 [Bacteroidota bacterium]
MVSNGCGDMDYSDVSGAYTVNIASAIISQSTAGQTQCTGGAFTPISVTAIGSNLSYQWYSNTIASNSGGTSLGSANGAQTNSYTPQAVTAGTVYYYCVVTGDCGADTSDVSGAFIVNQNQATAIISQSTAGQSQCINGSFTPITVTATGINLSYQWFSNTTASNTGGASLGSANGAQTYSYSPQVSATGTLCYYCVVTGDCGADTSDVSGAFLILPAPAILHLSTVGQTLCINDQTYFSPIIVIATSIALTYQWYSNIIPNNYGGTSLDYAYSAHSNPYFPPASTAGTVYYYCVVTGVCGLDTSDVSGAYIVNPATAIDSQSTAGQTQCLHGSFTPITVTTTGSNLSYQWFSNTTASNSGGTSLGSANGAQTYSYTPLASTAGTVFYYCVVTGNCGVPQLSAVSGAFNTTCQIILSTSVSNLTETSATVQWTSLGNFTFRLSYNLQSFDPNTEGIKISGLNNSYSFNALPSNTTVYYYLQSICGLDTTIWLGPYTFTTLCSPMSTSFIEDFEGVNFPPECWRANPVLASYNWEKIESSSAFGLGNSSIEANFYSQSSGVYDLITRSFNLANMASPVLRFDYAYAYYPDAIDSLNVYYSTNFGFTWTLLQSMDGNPGGTLVTAGLHYEPFFPSPVNWAPKTIQLPSTCNMIKLEAVSGWGNNLYLDNIGVIDNQPSVKNVNLHLFLEGIFDANTNNSMVEAQDIDWNSGLTFPKYGAGIADRIQVDLFNENAPNDPIGVSISGINLSTSGLASFQVSSSLNGNYYLKITDRNHLETWSAIPVPFNTNPVVYDFTTYALKAYQAPGGYDPQIQLTDGLFAFYLGDLDQSKSVDFDDFNLFEPYLNEGTYGFTIADFNGNGLVDFDDFNLFEPMLNLGPFSQYPGMP